MNRPRLLKLNCPVQSYAWGKVGVASVVAQLKASCDEGYVIDNAQPYAELWMGVHPKGPATISCPSEVEGTLLGAWLANNEWALGRPVANQFNGQLPFLFKVLSINKALSIQAHPDKPRAATLHSIKPDKYPDPNHKPELVIALTDFTGMCGFRPYGEIKSFIEIVPELRNVLCPESLSIVEASDISQETIIKKCFEDLMHQQDDVIAQQLTHLIGRLEKGSVEGLTNEEAQLLSQLYSWFPNDVGCFCLFLLNVVSLSPGQSLYLGPNIPHAYISGDVVECMANSDNVVRAGLTPKYRDKTTLCDMLHYTPRSPLEQLFKPKPHPQSPDIVLYDPPTPEFIIARIEMKNETVIPVVTGPSIILIVEGSGVVSVRGSSDIPEGSSNEVTFRPGEVLFIPAMNIITATPTNTTLIFQAYCEI